MPLATPRLRDTPRPVRRDGRPAARRAPRAVLVLSAIVVGLAGAFVVALALRFGLPAAVVVGHVLLVAGLLLVGLLGVATIQLALPRWPRLAVLPLALALGALALVDAVNWVARGAWMEVISLEMMASYAPRIYDVAAGASAVNGLWTLAAVFLLAGLPVAMVLWFGPAIAASVATAIDPPGVARAQHRRQRLGVCIAMVVATVALGAGYRAVKDHLALAGEPLSALFPGEKDRSAGDAATRARIPVVDAGAGGPASRVSAPDPISLVPGRKNVIVIVIDSLRPDRLSRFGYGRRTTPALDAFLDGQPQVVADWATSSCSISGCGILSLLGSAQYHRQGPHLTTVPDVLREAGYDIYFISSGDFTHGYPVLHERFGTTARMFVDGFSRADYPANDDRAIVAALDSVPRYAGRPAFFYFHLHSIHKGGNKYREPTYHPAFSDTAAWAKIHAFLVSGGNSVPGPQPVQAPLGDGDYDAAALARNDYDNAVLQADEVFGEIIGALSARGYLEDSVVLVTADHGEALGEHGNDGHGHDLYAESINVPLFIRDSTFAGTRHVPYARQVDVAPTILAALGVQAPPAWEGQSLLSGPVASQSFHQTTHVQPIRAVVWRSTQGTWKYTIDTRTGAESLFELESDPGERTNALATAPPVVVAALRAAVSENFTGPTPATAGH